jgi:uncharacterized membrane protein YphA (DoxX/SURF4 family)
MDEPKTASEVEKLIRENAHVQIPETWKVFMRENPTAALSLLEAAKLGHPKTPRESVESRCTKCGALMQDAKCAFCEAELGMSWFSEFNSPAPSSSERPDQFSLTKTTNRFDVPRSPAQKPQQSDSKQGRAFFFVIVCTVVVLIPGLLKILIGLYALFAAIATVGLLIGLWYTVSSGIGARVLGKDHSFNPVYALVGLMVIVALLLLVAGILSGDAWDHWSGHFQPAQ